MPNIIEGSAFHDLPNPHGLVGEAGVVMPNPRVAPPGTPLIITLVDGSTVQITAIDTDELAFGWTDPDGRTTTGGSPLVRSILRDGMGMAWDR